MDLDRIRRELEARKEELRSSLGVLVEVRRDPAASVSFGKRVGDGTTEAVERINQTSAARSLAGTLQAVEAALRRIDDGTYGVCVRCGAQIPAERLEAVPWTPYCVACSRQVTD
ncbi:MAG TPA: TraR/DksA C4-type zinc finger protein [Actinomycetota bacterium]